jgi:hypothetical protein
MKTLLQNPELKIQSSNDGVWLHFKASDGRAASLNVHLIRQDGSIVQGALVQWAKEFAGIADEKTALELAEDAIRYTLQRIGRDANLRYHAGAFTETFEKLLKAHCAITGEQADEVKHTILNGRLREISNAEKLQEIRELVENDEDGSPDASDKAKRAVAIMEIIRR